MYTKSWLRLFWGMDERNSVYPQVSTFQTLIIKTRAENKHYYLYHLGVMNHCYQLMVETLGLLWSHFSAVTKREKKPINLNACNKRANEIIHKIKQWKNTV